MEDRRPGYSMRLSAPGDTTTKEIVKWLKTKSGLDEGTLQKILGCRDYDIQFDSTVNIFEVFNKTKEVYTGTRFEGPFGKLIIVSAHPSSTSNADYFSRRGIEKLFSKYGKVLVFQRVKEDGICTGEIRVLVLTKDVQAFENDKDLRNAFYDINFRGGLFPLDAATVKDLWSKYGCEPQHTAETAERENDETKTMEKLKGKLENVDLRTGQLEHVD